MWRYVLHSLYRCKTNGQINIRCTARTFLCSHGCVPAELTTRPADSCSQKRQRRNWKWRWRRTLLLQRGPSTDGHAHMGRDKRVPPGARSMHKSRRARGLLLNLSTPWFNRCGTSGVAAAQVQLQWPCRDAATGCHRPGNPSTSNPTGKPSRVSPAGMLSAGARNAGPGSAFRRIAVSGYCRPPTSKVGGRASPSVGRSGAGNGMVG